MSDSDRRMENLKPRICTLCDPITGGLVDFDKRVYISNFSRSTIQYAFVSIIIPTSSDVYLGDVTNFTAE